MPNLKEKNRAERLDRKGFGSLFRGSVSDGGNPINGASASGKPTVFGIVIRRFESCRPNHFVATRQFLSGGFFVSSFFC